MSTGVEAGTGFRQTHRSNAESGLSRNLAGWASWQHGSRTPTSIPSASRRRSG